MFKSVVFFLAITYVNAGALLRGLGGFNGGLALAGGLTTGYGGAGLALGGGYGAGLALGGGYATGLSVPIGPVPAAIQSRRTYSVQPLALPQEPAIPQLIEVDAPVQPVNFVFRSQSSPISVQQVHTPTPGSYQSSRSEDEPHVLSHEVYKPIIQELREVIQPFRKVIQEVKPVLEDIHTVVAKGEPRLRAIAPIAPVAAIAPVAQYGAQYGAPIAQYGAPLLAKGY